MTASATRSPRRRRGATFWVLVAATTVFLSLEPGLFLVVLSIGLSALTLTWIVMLIRLLLLDAWARRSEGKQAVPSDDRRQ